MRRDLHPINTRVCRHDAGHSALRLLKLQDAPQDAPEIRQAVARIERMEAELERIEAGIAVWEGLG